MSVRRFRPPLGTSTNGADLSALARKEKKMKERCVTGDGRKQLKERNMTWEEEYERNQSRLRSYYPLCTHTGEDGKRCKNPGSYVYRGYFPDLSQSVKCQLHREQEQENPA